MSRKKFDVEKEAAKLNKMDRQRLSAAAAIELDRIQREEQMRLFQPMTRAGVRKKWGRGPYQNVQEDIWKRIEDDPNLFMLILSGGNRSCKTASSVQVVSEFLCGQGNEAFPKPALCKRFGRPPYHVRHLGTDIDKSILGVLGPYYKRNLIRKKLKGGTWDAAYSKASHRVDFKNGSTLEFLTYGQDVAKHQGWAGHIIAFDEWPTKDIWDEYRMRSIDEGALMIIAATPTAGTTEGWALELCEKAQTGQFDNRVFMQFDTRDNYHIDQRRVKELFEDSTDDERAMRFSGAWIPLGGRVIKEFRPDVTIIPPFMPPDHWPTCVAMDTHGKKPNMWNIGSIDIDNEPRAIHIWEEGSCSGTAEETNQMVRASLQGHNVDLYQIEPATQKEIHNVAENVIMRFTTGTHGLPWNKWRSDPWNRIQILKSLFTVRDVLTVNGVRQGCKLYIHSSCSATAHQIKHWSWRDPSHADRHTYSEKIRKVDDDHCDCVGIVAEWGESYLRQRIIRPEMMAGIKPMRRNIFGIREGY